MSKPGPLKMRWIKWVWKHTPNCADMTRLASRRLDEPLPWRMRLKIRLHFLICACCRRYFKHLQQVHEVAPDYAETVGTASPRGLSPDARKRIKVRLIDAGGS